MGKASKKKKSFDYTTLLLILLILVSFISMFFSPVEVEEYDLSAARKAVNLSYNEFKPECSLTGLKRSYSGTILILSEEYDNYTLKYIHEEILVGTNVRHVLMETIPTYVFGKAFAGVDGVTVYTDAEITEDMEWAQYVTIRPTAEFEEMVHPTSGFPCRFEISFAQLKNTVTRIAGDEKLMLAATVPFALLVILLSVLRQKSGRVNPMWPIFKPGFGKGLYIFFCVLTGLVVAVVLFCETAELDFYDQLGWDLYVITEFFLKYPTIFLVVVHLLFLGWDLCHKDFPWFIARWVVRAAIVVLTILISAVIGWLVGWIVGANLGLFRLLYFLGLTLSLCILVSGGRGVDKGITTRMDPGSSGGRGSFVTAEDGTSHIVSDYGYGLYVGDDQIVGQSDTTMTGISGQIYKKR